MAAIIVTVVTISYKFNGSAIDYNVYKTIHIGQFRYVPHWYIPHCSRHLRTPCSTMWPATHACR
ncbi:hypothetical protein [Muribaculum intestinale]|uniref:hypothetical protein n=1 Tax=Muribaculum intestinale TaxID=1796646 RepID=UPI003F668CDE